MYLWWKTTNDASKKVPSLWWFASKGHMSDKIQKLCDLSLYSCNNSISYVMISQDNYLQIKAFGTTILKFSNKSLPSMRSKKIYK